MRSALLPGWGQWAAGRRRRGAILLSLTAFAVLVPLLALLAMIHPFLPLLPLPGGAQRAIGAAGAALADLTPPVEHLYQGAGWTALGWSLFTLNCLLAGFRGWAAYDAARCVRTVGGRPLDPFGRIGRKGYRTFVPAATGLLAGGLVVIPHLGFAVAAVAARSLLTPVLVSQVRPLPAQSMPPVGSADPFDALLPQLPAGESGRPLWDGKSPLNVLLLGTDRRPQEATAQPWGNSDTILLVSVDPGRRQATMISIPRDMLVGNIPGVGQEKINAAYRRGGPELAVRVVGDLLGLPIHRWASIDVSAFATLIDSLGGVIVDVERPIRDDEYPADNYAVRRILIPAGLHWLDGERALWYARSRHGSTDFDRSGRQQRLLLSLKSRLRDPSVLPRLPSLITSLAEAVQTDVSPREALTLARLGVKSDVRTVRGLVLAPPEYGRVINSPGLYAIVPNRERIRREVAALLSSEPASPAATSAPTSVRSLPLLPGDAEGDGASDPGAFPPIAGPAASSP